MRDDSPHSTNGKNGHADQDGAAFSRSTTAASTRNDSKTQSREYSQSAQDESAKPILITGGAGFVGTNLAHRLLSEGRHVLVFDNLSRAGVENKLCWS